MELVKLRNDNTLLSTQLIKRTNEIAEKDEQLLYYEQVQSHNEKLQKQLHELESLRQKVNELEAINEIAQNETTAREEVIKSLQTRLQSVSEEKDTFLQALLANKANQAEALDAVNDMNQKLKKQQDQLEAKEKALKEKEEEID